MATPKACDPWAVHSAKRTAEQQTILTPVQEKILALIRENGPLTAQEICEKAGLSENEFQRNFATLRHMELARAFKAEDGVRYTLFDK
jgi:predicted HTH transcriptional regulator